MNIMKKTFNWKQKLWKMTRFFLFIAAVQLTALTTLFANEAASQEIKSISIESSWNDITLEDVFSDVQDQTDYTFTYDSKLIENIKVTGVENNDLSLFNLLYYLSGKTGLQFSLEGKNILVYEGVNKLNARRNSINLPSSTELPQALEKLKSSVILQVDSATGDQLISGQVTDETGQPLIAATVRIKETGQGAITDANGQFQLDVVDSAEARTLVISYVGYATQEILIGDQTDFSVQLGLDDSALNEIVVVGYGTQRKSDLVSAVATTDLEKATLSPTTDVNEMLRGRIAGLQVSVGGGSLRPGGTSDIIFRGRSSIEGNTTGIYVVDGVVRNGGIEDINPDDIASIEFLKDASAQAIYGSRAVNGVVLITTKRGKTGEIAVNYHGYRTTRNIERNFDVYSGQEFADLRREAFRTTNADGTFLNDDEIFSDVELESLNNNRFVDWEDELLTTGQIDNHTLGLTAGSENTQVYGSLGYFNEEGIIPSSAYTRSSLRVNVNQKVNEKLSARIDVNLLNEDTERAANVNVIGFSPLGRAFDDNGNVIKFPSGEDGTAISPLWNLQESDHDEIGNDFIVTLLPTYEITDDLTYQLKGSLTRRTSERGQYLSSEHGSGDTDNGIARIDNQLREAYLIENILTYDKTFNDKHSGNLTFVQAVDENDFTRTFTEGTGFINESLGYDGISNAIGSVFVNRDKTRVRTASFMGRARYNLLDKYLVTATLRSDGASVNADEFKWTNNPAVAVAWKLHNEDFLSNANDIDQLKMRVSYGSLANALTRPYTSLFTADEFNYVFNGQSAAGYAPNVILPNQQLRHETITTFNTGLDFSLFNRLLFGSIDYYDSRTKDLLLRRGVPSVTGFQYTFFNAGELQNKGFEIGLQSYVIDKEDLRVSLSTNWSNNSNELIELYNDGEGNEITEDDAYNYFVGQPIGVIRNYQYDGIWQEGDDFANAPQANPDSIDPQPDLRPGDIRVQDINGDGLITLDDRVFTDGNPDWFGSFSTNVNYKGVELLADFYAVKGAQRVNPILSTFNNISAYSGSNNGVQVPYYTPENPSAAFPRPNADSTPKYLNAFAIRDASYLRLRTLNLGYNLPENLLSNLKINNVKVYLTGTNVFTDTDYLGYSPEVNVRNTLSSADTGYPDAKSFTFGIKIQP